MIVEKFNNFNRKFDWLPFTGLFVTQSS